ncbi:MAG: DUF2141 domain-containing protein [Polyangiaceae bacterium]|nr:DUF2141 domain-containing protein [Polyangiaceae bacterium]
MSRRTAAGALVSAALGLSAGAGAEPAGYIKVEVSGLKHNQNEAVCALYDRPEAFPSESDVRAGRHAPIADRRAVCRFEGVPAGRYAVAVFHDEDGDRRLSKVLGVPREGYGFSNGAKAGSFGPPKFAAAAFEFDGKAKRVPVSITYP